MRTTISIDENLLNTLKLRAAASGSTVSRLIEDAVRHSLQQQEPEPTKKFKLVTWGAGDATSEVDLTKAWQILDGDDVLRYRKDH